MRRMPARAFRHELKCRAVQAHAAVGSTTAAFLLQNKPSHTEVCVFVCLSVSLSLSLSLSARVMMFLFILHLLIGLEVNYSTLSDFALA